MKLIIAMGLIFIMFFVAAVAGPAHAAINQPGQSPVTVGQPDGATCLNPVTVTTATGSQVIFAGPKAGWLKVPVYKQTLACCQAFK